MDCDVAQKQNRSTSRAHEAAKLIPESLGGVHQIHPSCTIPYTAEVQNCLSTVGNKKCLIHHLEHTISHNRDKDNNPSKMGGTLEAD